jgi:arylformamidase
MQEDHHPSDDGMSRRAVLACAAAGALALTSDQAAAQRCPEPPRPKGPLVWLDLDQRELDDAYDQSVYAFNAKNIEERRAANNEQALAAIGRPERVAYGPTEIEKLDIYKTRRPNAPTLIFIHGGAWLSGRSANFAVYAEPFIKAGANFVAVDFDSVRDTNGDLFPMVDQCRRAVAFVYRNAASFGGNPDALYLCSRSSGSHLAGCVLITEWARLGVPSNVLKGAVLGSGMYDLKPVRMSKRGAYVKFTDEMEQELSAQRHIDKINTPIVLAHGTLETPEFQRQSRDFAAALGAAGKPVQLLVAKGYNHYEVGETIGHPYAVLGRAAMEMMRLNAA